MHIENFKEVPSFSYIIKIIKSRRVGGLAGIVARMGDKRNAYGALVGKPEGKNPVWKICE
jgi:hypothetical protein